MNIEILYKQYQNCARCVSQNVDKIEQLKTENKTKRQYSDKKNVRILKKKKRNKK